MGFTTFMAEHTLGVAMFFIIGALIYKFGIQPRLGMTDKEIKDKVTKTIEEVTENLKIDPGDILDESTMPNLNQG